MKQQTVLSTYTLSVLNQSHALPKILLEHSITFKQKESSLNDSTLPTKISSRYLKSCLNGPFKPFICQLLQSYSNLINLNQQIALHSESIFKQSNNDQSIPINKLNKLSQIEIERTKENLNSKAIELNQELNKKITQWSSQLQEQFKKNEPSFSPDDQTEFDRIYPYEELISLFVDLNIPIPKVKKSLIYSFKHYFSLKCRHAICTILTKSHQPINEKTITQQLKHFKSTLNTIEKEEKEFSNRTKEDLNEITKLIHFAKVAV
jgi:hypothetical protein